MKQNRAPLLNVGIPSLFLIFLLLCLVTFSVLSLSSAKADEKLSQKTADRVTEYYTASNEANRTLSQVDTDLMACYEKSENETAYRQNVTDLFSSQDAFEVIDSDSSDTGLTLQWQTPINDSQALFVCLDVVYPTSDGESFYQITKWETQNTTEWTPDLSQPVYQGSQE
jgi:type II secretory pathway component PulJ